jgi:hypothetical protein
LTRAEPADAVNTMLPDGGGGGTLGVLVGDTVAVGVTGPGVFVGVTGDAVGVGRGVGVRGPNVGVAVGFGLPTN